RIARPFFRTLLAAVWKKFFYDRLPCPKANNHACPNNRGQDRNSLVYLVCLVFLVSLVSLFDESNRYNKSFRANPPNKVADDTASSVRIILRFPPIFI
ncbi:MAG: hypothetical protein ABIL02_03595, partial [candidate division WOR-3 bacterium]